MSYLEDKEVNTFPKGITPKVNAIARLELKLAFYDVIIQQFVSDKASLCLFIFISKMKFNNVYDWCFMSNSGAHTELRTVPFI